MSQWGSVLDAGTTALRHSLEHMRANLLQPERS